MRSPVDLFGSSPNTLVIPSARFVMPNCRTLNPNFAQPTTKLTTFCTLSGFFAIQSKAAISPRLDSNGISRLPIPLKILRNPFNLPLFSFFTTSSVPFWSSTVGSASTLSSAASSVARPSSFLSKRRSSLRFSSSVLDFFLMTSVCSLPLSDRYSVWNSRRVLNDESCSPI